MANDGIGSRLWRITRWRTSRPTRTSHCRQFQGPGDGRHGRPYRHRRRLEASTYDSIDTTEYSGHVSKANTPFATALCFREHFQLAIFAILYLLWPIAMGSYRYPLFLAWVLRFGLDLGIRSRWGVEWRLRCISPALGMYFLGSSPFANGC